MADTDAQVLCAILHRSRHEETPGRRRPLRTIRQRLFPVVPVSPNGGVSRDEVLERIRPWGLVWDRPRLDRAVKVLVDRGVLRFGSRGLYLLTSEAAVQLADEVM